MNETQLIVLCEQIESLRFAALLNVASDLRTFLRAARRRSEVQQLNGALNDPVLQSLLIRRLSALLSKPCDSQLEHPHDTAVAVYLWLLAFQKPDVAQAIALQVLEIGNLWWSNKLAREVVGYSRSQTSASWNSVAVVKAPKTVVPRESPTDRWVFGVAGAQWYALGTGPIPTKANTGSGESFKSFLT